MLCRRSVSMTGRLASHLDNKLVSARPAVALRGKLQALGVTAVAVIAVVLNSQRPAHPAIVRPTDRWSHGHAAWSRLHVFGPVASSTVKSMWEVRKKFCQRCSQLTGATTRLQRQQEHAINAAHVMCNSMPP